MAREKLYRMPLSIENEVSVLDFEEEKRMAAKVCFACSMRHIFKPEDELVELDEFNAPLRSYHINCAPKGARSTEAQFIAIGRSPEEAKILADKTNNRHFVLQTEMEKDPKEPEIQNLLDSWAKESD